jgi:hypothetical protein
LGAQGFRVLGNSKRSTRLGFSDGNETRTVMCHVLSRARGLFLVLVDGTDKLESVLHNVHFFCHGLQVWIGLLLRLYYFILTTPTRYDKGGRRVVVGMGVFDDRGVWA